jgi:hypothetical protein
MKSIQRALALVLVYVMVGLLLPAPAAAEGANLVNPKLLAGLVPPPAARMPAQQDKQAPAGKVWTHGGKIMTVIGLACVGAGAVMMTRENTEIGDTGTAINWRATGAVWMGAGAVLTVIGLTRRR